MSRILVVLIILISYNANCAHKIYPFENQTQELRFNSLLKQLRCVVCQNQDLADSNAFLAKDLRLKIYDFIKEGKTDVEIKSYLTTRYGEFILFKPPFVMNTLFLWLAPLFLVFLALVIYWKICLKAPK